MLNSKELSRQDFLDFFEHILVMSAQMTVQQSVIVYFPVTPQGEKFKRQLLSAFTRNMTFAAALKFAGAGLSPFELLLIKTGEETGDFASGISEIIKIRKEMADMRSELRSSLTMPVITLVIGFIMFVVGIFVVLPKFETMFLSAQSMSDLPEETRFIFTAARNIRHYFIYVVIAFIATGFYIVKFLDVASLPVIGKLIRYRSLYVWFVNMYMLLNAGITPQVSIDYISQSLGRNSILYNKFGDSLSRVSRLLRQNVSLIDAISRQAYFGKEVAIFFEMAVQTGNYHDTMSTAREKYKKIFSNNLDMTVKLLNPILFILTAIMITIFVMGMYIPIFQSANAIK